MLLVTLINNERKKLGKGTVGFINPTLYASIGNFTDITSGDNKCCIKPTGGTAPCGTSGFTTSAGWDPVTGLGSITFAKLGKILINSNFTYQKKSTKPETATNSSIWNNNIIIGIIAGGVIILGCIIGWVTYYSCCKSDSAGVYSL